MPRKHPPIFTSRTPGWKLAQATGRCTEKAAVGLFRWATTDHSGMTETLRNMPPMGFGETLKYILMRFLFFVLMAVVSGFWIFVLIAYVLPFLITESSNRNSHNLRSSRLIAVRITRR